ncbi:7762_t:CDS:2, partial [Acaulospora morrowiae]
PDGFSSHMNFTDGSRVHQIAIPSAKVPDCVEVIQHLRKNVIHIDVIEKPNVRKEQSGEGMYEKEFCR